jgi:hypothetical protein
VDEGRLAFLTHQTVSGIRFFKIGEHRYKLIAPSKEILLLAEHIYQETLSSLRFDNLINKEKASRILVGMDIWRPQDDDALKTLEKHLEDRKVDLYQALYDSERQDRMRRAIKTIKSGLNKSLAKKHSLDYMTVEYHASVVKQKFITALCLRDEADKPIYTEKTFWNEDSSILESVISRLDRDIITIEEFRELARNDPWRTIWNLSKESCLGVPSSEFTNDQKTLVTFAKMYDNAYQSMDCPPDEVLEDDDMFDGWMIDQRRQREKDQKQKTADKINNIPDKAQEVFLTAPTREDADRIYAMNDQDATMKIKQRQAMIEKTDGSLVDAKNLPDTQMELRQQQMQEYKDKMKGGRI